MAGTRERVGKRVRGALYLHRDALPSADPEHRARIERAAAIAGDRPWSVARVEETAPEAVSLLDYEDFEEAAFPALRASHRVDLEAQTVVTRRHGGDNPPVLHRKEQMLTRDDPRRPAFAALTEALVARGLFTDMSRRGRRQPWEAALEEAGVVVEGHAVVDLLPPEPPTIATDTAPETPGDVLRHRTAIARGALSAPMNALHAAGLITLETRILDYGCGQGDDVRALQLAGHDATGWDPHYAPDPKALRPAGVVNLGFVLNVIENTEERRTALKRAWDLAEGCLSIAVMLVGKGDVSGLQPYKDGYLTRRRTFQKYYTQAELRAFIEETLETSAIAAGGGLFFVFRDEALEQRYLMRRQLGFVATRQAPRAPRRAPRAVREREARSAEVETLVSEVEALIRDLGRTPDPLELPPGLRVRMAARNLGHARAVRLATDAIAPEDIEARVEERREDIALFFALQAFEKRRSYGSLSPELQRDVRAFFGSGKRAMEAGRARLFSAGEAEGLAEDAMAHAAEGIGHVEGDKYQVHVRDLGRLAPRLRAFVAIGERLAGDLTGTTLFRIHLGSRKLNALVYEDFDTSPLPRLSTRTRIDLCTGEVGVFDHTSSERLGILYMKSRYMAAEDPALGRQRAFDENLAAIPGLDFSRQGPPLRTVVAAIRENGMELP